MTAIAAPAASPAEALEPCERAILSVLRLWSALDIDAQLASTHRAVAERGWELAGTVIDAGVSGAVDPDRRDALGPVLAALDAGDGDALVVARLDRITPSVLAWAELLKRSQRRGWVLVAVAESLDIEASDARDRAESEALLAAESFEAA